MSVNLHNSTTSESPSNPLSIFILPLVAIVVMVVLMLLLKKSKRDGMNERGEYDAEPTASEIAKSTTIPDGFTPKNNPIPDNVYSNETYEEHPISMANFDISEFDSHGTGEKGTGVKMRISHLLMLDKARTIAGIPYKINSGFRTETHNKKVGGVSDSAHKYGYASDIAATKEEQRNKILKALYEAGFRRFGVARTFIHVDNDPNKPTPAIWNYDGFKITFNPLLQSA